MDQLKRMIGLVVGLLLTLAVSGLCSVCFNIDLKWWLALDKPPFVVPNGCGPILGMFAFGIFTKKKVNDRFVPLVAVAAPVLCLILQSNSERWFGGYKFSYELLLFNALFTVLGLCLLIRKGPGKAEKD